MGPASLSIGTEKARRRKREKWKSSIHAKTLLENRETILDKNEKVGETKLVM